MDTSDPIRFLIGIDLFLSCNPNVLYGIYKSGKLTFVYLSHTTVVLVWTYMIYVRDNVIVQNAGHYRVNKPRQGEPDRDVKRRCLASP